ncbi:MAG: ShlB/FhaC/HecB family hemolysin secretion/activation protein [Schwartzia succinivorans]|jgi:hemolysin activation/secretion protein|nr:ShlB/FhaC/HecB family hemolysin secretion/activation protein [Schwartzia succinivorans]
MMKLSKKKKLLAAALAGASLFAFSGTGYATPAETMPGAIADENGETAYVVTDLVISGNHRHTDGEIHLLVPEATRSLVRPGKLSRQLSLINDGQVMRIESAFVPTDIEGVYALHLIIEETPDNHYSVGLSNTGDKRTGDWRLALGWYNTDISGNGDTLGFSYTTSPDEHLSDVTQIALTYKTILPNAGDSAFFSYSYSDTDMGQIGTFNNNINPNAAITATGRGHTMAFHYQRNLFYTRAHHQLLDFGLDYKRYESGQHYEGVQGTTTEYDVALFSATYHDIIRRERDMFAWNVGWATNLGGNGNDYAKVRANSTRGFNLFRLGASYQHTTESDWLFGVNAYSQWTKDNLLSSEQFGAGGMGSVRGFKDRVATGDNGIGGSLEIYTPQYLPDSRFVLFFDAAYVGNNHVNAGEVGNRNLASFGIGYRFGSDKLGLYASIDYAKIVSYGGLHEHECYRPWTFTLTKTF